MPILDLSYVKALKNRREMFKLVCRLRRLSLLNPLTPTVAICY